MGKFRRRMTRLGSRVGGAGERVGRAGQAVWRGLGEGDIRHGARTSKERYGDVTRSLEQLADEGYRVKKIKRNGKTYYLVGHTKGVSKGSRQRAQSKADGFRLDGFRSITVPDAKMNQINIYVNPRPAGASGGHLVPPRRGVGRRLIPGEGQGLSPAEKELQDMMHFELR